ncbi:hypothetical protein Tco_0949626 [Tanacetum coccineum]
MSTKPSRNVESPSWDAKLALTDSEMEPGWTKPCKQDEGQAGSNPGDATEIQPQTSHVVHARPNLKHMDLEENLKLPIKDKEEEPEKTNTESEVQSMVIVPIPHNTSSVPPMTTPVIDLTLSQPISTTVHAPLPTSTETTITITTTTTTLSPPPPQPHKALQI